MKFIFCDNFDEFCEEIKNNDNILFIQIGYDFYRKTLQYYRGNNYMFLYFNGEDLSKNKHFNIHTKIIKIKDKKVYLEVDKKINGGIIYLR